MKMRLLIPAVVAATAASLLLGGCRKTPEGVLNREQMAQLMADIHIAEAVIDFNFADFNNDSLRKVLKQSIYETHGVTAELVDSSLTYYGHHLEDYMLVYDRTIEILEQRQAKYAAGNSGQVSLSGDSVTIWQGPERLRVYPAMASRIVPFEFTPDSTWHNGDVYTLRFKVLNAQPNFVHRLMVDYTDGSTTYADDAQWLAGNAMQLNLQVDSTLTPTRVYGYLQFNPVADNDFEIDSLLVTRMRHNLKPIHVVYPVKRYRPADEGQHAAEAMSEDSVDDFDTQEGYYSSTTHRPTTAYPSGVNHRQLPPRNDRQPSTRPSVRRQTTQTGSAASQNQADHNRRGDATNNKAVHNRREDATNNKTVPNRGEGSSISPAKQADPSQLPSVTNLPPSH